MYATLVDRGHTKAELETLDDFWLHHVYWHPRDKAGNIAIRPKPRDKTKLRKDYWLDWGRGEGWPDWYSLERWQEEEKEKKANPPRKARQGRG